MNNWMPTTVGSSLADLTALQSLVRSMDPLSDSLQFLSNLLLIRSCGHLDTTEKACIEDLFERLYGRVVHDYLDKTTFRSGRNPSYKNLAETLGLIDGSKSIKGELKAHLSQPFIHNSKVDFPQTYRECLDRLVNNRNSVVHGYSLHIQSHEALAYSDLSIQISNWYLSFFKPGGRAEEVLGPVYQKKE